MSAGAETVLSFWLGDGLQLDWPSADRSALWFGGGKQLDGTITDLFGSWVRRAVAGDLQEWEADPRSRLALVILLDQFTRNVYRGQPQAFAGDARALRLTVQTLSSDEHLGLPLAGQVFMNLPLEHHEDLALQDQCVAQFQALHARAPDPVKPRLQGFLESAAEHRAIVAQFGRFPHRNTVLGRSNTPAEEAYLASAKRFGQ
ncbi:MAG: hypothetical protein RLZZ126_1481 [Pseudomonadota bacterium]|jgi:uncharacterized protein (DUF924 family)